MRVLFVHSVVDDAGLSPGAFRVLGNLARRADKRRRAWPSIAGMADVCRMRKTGVIAAVKELERAGWVVAHRSHGKKTMYVLAAGRSPKLTGSNGRVVAEGDRLDRETGSIGRTHWSNRENALVKSGDSKDIQKGNPERKSNTRAGRVGECESIYAAYPRKVGKHAALRAIAKAIRGGADPGLLLERVKAFAAASAGTEVRFIPHPATWFNQGRWEDETAPVARIESEGESVRIVADESGPSEPPSGGGADASHLAWLEAQQRQRAVVTPGGNQPFATETSVSVA